MQSLFRIRLSPQNVPFLNSERTKIHPCSVHSQLVWMTYIDQYFPPLVAWLQGVWPFGAVVRACIYPHTFYKTRRYLHIQLTRREAQCHHLPRFIVGPLLGILLGVLMGSLLVVPLSALLGARLQFFRGMIWDQGLFQEVLLSLHQFWYHHRHSDHCHPAPLLQCHPHGWLQKNRSHWKIGQQTAVPLAISRLFFMESASTRWMTQIGIGLSHIFWLRVTTLPTLRKIFYSSPES